MEPTHPDKLVENATAPSAGGSPDGEGEDSRRGAEAQRMIVRGGLQNHQDGVWQRLEGIRKGAFDHAPPPGNSGRSVRSLSGSGSESGSESIPVLVGTWPSWTAQTSLPSCVNTAIIRLRYPVSHVRIPSRVLSIPRPIATPTPILLRH